MTDDFIILNDAELDQMISGGALHMPPAPTPGHNPWHLPQLPIGPIALFI